MANSARKTVVNGVLILLTLWLAGCQPGYVNEGYQDPYYAPQHPQPGYPNYGGYPYYGGYPPGGYYVIEPERRPDVRGRIEEVQRSIDRGQKQGGLTSSEAQELNRELDAVRSNVERMGSDGHLNSREQQRINSDLNRLQGNIRREKRDDERERRSR